VIVENTEFEPLPPYGPPGLAGEPGPPAPTVIGYVVAVTVIPAGAFKGDPGLPDCGLQDGLA
jgi:hypothetical protein